MRLKDIIPIAGIGLFLGYMYKDKTYYSEPPKQEYKQEFVEELGQFSNNMKRTFPRNADQIGTINITLYIDAEFKRNHDSWLDPTDNESWKGALEDSLEKASQRFYDEFKISFTVDDVKYWNPEEFQWSTMYGVLIHLASIENESIGSLGITGRYMDDITVGLAGVIKIEKDHKIALYATVRDLEYDILDPLTYEEVPLENIIQHELSHWFGAIDSIYEKTSIMDYGHFTKTTEWDIANKTRMNEEIPIILEYIKLQKDLKTKPR